MNTFHNTYDCIHDTDAYSGDMLLRDNTQGCYFNLMSLGGVVVRFMVPLWSTSLWIPFIFQRMNECHEYVYYLYSKTRHSL